MFQRLLVEAFRSQPVSKCEFGSQCVKSLNFVFVPSLQVSMMEDGGTAARIKQEIDSCCSPSPTSSNNNISILSFGSSAQEPVSLSLKALLLQLLMGVLFSDGLQMRIRYDYQLGAAVARLTRSSVLQLYDIRNRGLWKWVKHSGCSKGGIAEVKSVTADKLTSQTNPDLFLDDCVWFAEMSRQDSTTALQVAKPVKRSSSERFKVRTKELTQMNFIK